MTKTAHAKWMVGPALAVAGVASTGCADLSRATSLAPSGVNVESPVAATVAEASRHAYPYPKLKSLPLKPKPADIRKPESFGMEVADLGRKQGALRSWTAANPPFNAAGEAFADSQRGRFPTAVGADAPPPESADLSEAWAAKRRAAAQPPPPPK